MINEDVASQQQSSEKVFLGAWTTLWSHLTNVTAPIHTSGGHDGRHLNSDELYRDQRCHKGV